MKPKLTPDHFYHRNPTVENATGDIWKDLPSLGLFGQKHCSGIVITPACDLANNKVDTVTYLPIIPVRDWLSQRFIYPQIRNSVVEQLHNHSVVFDQSTLPKSCLPMITKLETLENTVKAIPCAVKDVGKLKTIGRLLAGIELLKLLSTGQNITDQNKLELVLSGKSFHKMQDDLVRNSFSSDLHFLPHDQEDEEWSALPKHSVILFRYPITAPLEVFNLAQDANNNDWAASIESLSQLYPISEYYKEVRPMKIIRLKGDFLSDMLTRFVSLYVRLGSPDFTPDTISEIKKEI